MCSPLANDAKDLPQASFPYNASGRPQASFPSALNLGIGASPIGHRPLLYSNNNISASFQTILLSRSIVSVLLIILLACQSGSFPTWPWKASGAQGFDTDLFVGFSLLSPVLIEPLLLYSQFPSPVSGELPLPTKLELHLWVGRAEAAEG